MTSEIMKEVGSMLIEKHLTVAFAESATAGRLTAEFSMIDNAGKFLKGGIACYDACIKEDLLHVDHQLIEDFTPESMEVTKAIAVGLNKAIPSDIQIGITGLTCAGGSETAEKPVGTMFICGTRNGDAIFSERLHFDGEREEIVEHTIEKCGELLKDYLQSLN
ncbi:nicotinamide-nucleotide amidohydrolase family protein [Pedobacter petrophilus]|uniref:Nicotinamide-nucleotide amidohydrolase family protein n=1 Tax=Pedobacter petrophilus TaxID=1908241 RepID=A0A7K0G2C2_9SPHI|nr:CinA family protein [Pedobacter petrophilus]MRX77967.1 nicotinamide-nucleotide amidohydrolase family protein [Pedobacter petrophilus]